MTPLSIAEINDAIIAQIESQISQTVPLLPVAFVRVLAKAIAGVVVLIYKYTGFIFLQMFVATASSRATTIGATVVTPLIEWGRLVGAGDPVPAVAAELTVDVAVVNQTGNPIPTGTPLVYTPNGLIYLTTATILRDAATKSVNIVASSDQAGGDGLGAIGNLDIGALVSFANPLADVDRDTTVTALVTSGEDEEDLDTLYRQRVIDRFQKRPQGGALSDLEIWPEEAAGIINAYPYTGDLPGTVEVYCEADPVSSGSPDGFPTQPQLDAAEALIDLDENGYATRRPANMFVFVRSITRRDFTVEIPGLEAPDLPGTKLAITDGLTTLFKTFEPFIGGLSVTPRDRVTATEVGAVAQDIARANNGTFSTLLLRAAPQTQTVFAAFVTVSDNDASETAGVVTLVGTTLAMVAANTIGARFVNVNVPVGAAIVSATLTLTAKTIKTAYSVITIRGEAAPNAAIFTVAANDLTDRTPTINSSTWIPTQWAVDGEYAIDVTAIVAEVIAINGWAALNSLAVLITADAGADREAYSYDDTPGKAPQISITYTAPGSPYTTQSVVTLGRGEKAKVSSVTFP